MRWSIRGKNIYLNLNARRRTGSSFFGRGHLEYYSYGPLVVSKLLKIIKEAEKENFDGAIIGCFYDPGLREAREIAEKLVVTAPAEASMHIAATLGQRFSIIVGRTKWIPLS